MATETEQCLTISVTGFRPRIEYGVTFFRRNDGRDTVTVQSCADPMVARTFVSAVAFTGRNACATGMPFNRER